VSPKPVLTEQDIYLFREGSHATLYNGLGCHLREGGGAHFAVWAPNARAISVIGDWNGWRHGADVMNPRWDSSGIWECDIAQVRQNQAQRCTIRPINDQDLGDKTAERAAEYCEHGASDPERWGSYTADPGHDGSDGEPDQDRHDRQLIFGRVCDHAPDKRTGDRDDQAGEHRHADIASFRLRWATEIDHYVPSFIDPSPEA